MIAWMLYASAVTLLLAAAAAAVEPVVRDGGGGTRYLWLAVLLAGAAGGLGLPWLVTPFPTGSVVPPEYAADRVMPTPLESLHPPAASGEAVPAGDVSGSAAVWAREVVAGRVAALDEVAGAGWLLASLLALGALTLSTLRLRRLRAAGRVRRLRGLDLVYHPTRGPAAAGVIRPWLLLPVWIGSLPREQKRLVLRHELEHVRGRDPALKLAGALVVAAMPWNPAAWWSLRRLHQAMELDCDRRVVGRSGRAVEYARFLLDIAAGRRMPAPAAAAMHLTGNLERRLLAMVTPQRTALHQRLLRSLLAIAAIAVMVVLRPPAAPAFGQSGTQPALQTETPSSALAGVQSLEGGVQAGATVADAILPVASDAALPHGEAVTASDVQEVTPPAVPDDGSVSGLVVDHDGQPLSGVLIRIPEAEIGTVTARDGRFLIPYLPAGTYRLQVSGSGYRSQAVEDVRVTPGYRSHLTLTMSRTGQQHVPALRHEPTAHRLSEGPARFIDPRTAQHVLRELADVGSLIGTVGDLAGEAVSGAQVRVMDMQVGSVSDVTGRFLLPRLGEGTYRLLVSAPGYVSQTVDDIRILAGHRSELFITLSRNGQPPIPPSHEEPAPAPGRPAAAPRPAPSTPNPPVMPMTLPAPAAAPLPVAPTPAAVAPAPAAVAPQPAPRPAPAAAARMSPAPPPPPPPHTLGDYRIRGVVVDSAGEPVLGVYAHLEGTNWGTVANAEGRFTMNVAEGGRHTLRLIAPDFVTRQVEAEAVLGEGEVVRYVLLPVR